MFPWNPLGSSGFLSITCPRVLVCICNKCYNFFHNNQVSVNWLYCEPVSRAKSGWGTLWFLLRFSRFLECMHSGWAVETSMIMWCVFVCSLFSAVACQEKRYWACPFIRQACISNYLQIKTVAFAPYIFPIKGVGFRVGLFFFHFYSFPVGFVTQSFPITPDFLLEGTRLRFLSPGQQGWLESLLSLCQQPVPKCRCSLK